MMSSDLDVATIPPGPGFRHPELRGVFFLVLAAALFWFAVEAADPNFAASRRAGLVELLPVWLRVPLILLTSLIAGLTARTFFKVAQASWVLVVSTIGLAIPTMFGWKTFEWSAFDSVIIDGGGKPMIRLRFADRSSFAWLKRGGLSTLKLRQVNYDTPIAEITQMIERRCPRLRAQSG